MNKLAMSAAFLLTCVGQAASAQAGGVDVQKYIAQQGWTPYEGKGASMPFADLAPVMYVAKGQNAPRLRVARARRWGPCVPRYPSS